MGPIYGDGLWLWPFVLGWVMRDMLKRFSLWAAAPPKSQPDSWHLETGLSVLLCGSNQENKAEWGGLGPLIRRFSLLIGQRNGVGMPLGGQQDKGEWVTKEQQVRAFHQDGEMF